MKLKKLRSYGELRSLYRTNPRVAKAWAKCASENLGGPTSDDFEVHMRNLDDNASETCCGEDGVTDEVNFVKDIVEKELGVSK